MTRQYVPRRLDFSVHLLEPVSLLLLALAFYFGFKRVGALRTATLLNHNLVDSKHQGRDYSKMLMSDAPIHDFTGRIRPRAEVQADVERCKQDAVRFGSQLVEIWKDAGKFQLLRDRFLIVGFAAIFLAKVLQPYGESVCAGASATNQPPQIQLQTTQSLVSPKVFQPALAPSGSTQSNAPQKAVRP